MEVITDRAIRLIHHTNRKIHKGFHFSPLERFVQRRRGVNLEKVLDAADPIEANDEYHVKEVIGSCEKKGKVIYLVKWRGCPAKKDRTRQNYESLYLVGAKEDLQRFHSKNPRSPRDPAVKIKN
jgi:hypothetical protein